MKKLFENKRFLRNLSLVLSFAIVLGSLNVNAIEVNAADSGSTVPSNEAQAENEAFKIHEEATPTEVHAGDEVTLKYQVTAKGTAGGNEELDVVFVVDAQTDSNKIQSLSAKVYSWGSSLLKTNNTKVGLVGVDGNKTNVIELTDKDNPGNKDWNNHEGKDWSIASKIKAEANNGKNLQAGIVKAEQMLSECPDKAQKVIIVVSDGCPTYSNTDNNADTGEINIFSLADLNSKVQFNLLKSGSLKGDGKNLIYVERDDKETGYYYKGTDIQFTDLNKIYKSSMQYDKTGHDYTKYNYAKWEKHTPNNSNFGLKKGYTIFDSHAISSDVVFDARYNLSGNYWYAYKYGEGFLYNLTADEAAAVEGLNDVFGSEDRKEYDFDKTSRSKSVYEGYVLDDGGDIQIEYYQQQVKKFTHIEPTIAEAYKAGKNNNIEIYSCRPFEAPSGTPKDGSYTYERYSDYALKNIAYASAQGGNSAKENGYVKYDTEDNKGDIDEIINILKSGRNTTKKDVQLTVNLPAHLDYTGSCSKTRLDGGPLAYDDKVTLSDDKKTVTIDLGDIEAGKTVEISFNAMVNGDALSATYNKELLAGQSKFDVKANGENGVKVSSADHENDLTLTNSPTITAVAETINVKYVVGGEELSTKELTPITQVGDTVKIVNFRGQEVFIPSISDYKDTLKYKENCEVYTSENNVTLGTDRSYIINCDDNVTLSYKRKLLYVGFYLEKNVKNSYIGKIEVPYGEKPTEADMTKVEGFEDTANDRFRQKALDNNYLSDLVFSSWMNDEDKAVSEDDIKNKAITHTTKLYASAQNGERINYEITFKNHTSPEGITVLGKLNESVASLIPEGMKDSYTDWQHTYLFSDFVLDGNRAIVLDSDSESEVKVTGDMTFNAEYYMAIRKYNVHFVGINDEDLGCKSINAGKVISGSTYYDGFTAKEGSDLESTNEYSFTTDNKVKIFSGWNITAGEGAAATAAEGGYLVDKELWVRATCEEREENCTITWYYTPGSYVTSSVRYGDPAAYNFDEANTHQPASYGIGVSGQPYYYTPDGKWYMSYDSETGAYSTSADLSKITDNITVYAGYTPVDNYFTVTFSYTGRNELGDTNELFATLTNVTYGTTVAGLKNRLETEQGKILPETTTEFAVGIDEIDTRSFTGWDHADTDVITADTDIVAIGSDNPVKYLVTFKIPGQEDTTGWVTNGTAPSGDIVPEDSDVQEKIQALAENEYNVVTFEGWKGGDTVCAKKGALSPIKAATTFEAQYSTVAAVYTVKVYVDAYYNSGTKTLARVSETDSTCSFIATGIHGATIDINALTADVDINDGTGNGFTRFEYSNFQVPGGKLEQVTVSETDEKPLTFTIDKDGTVIINLREVAKTKTLKLHIVDGMKNVIVDTDRNTDTGEFTYADFEIKAYPDQVLTISKLNLDPSAAQLLDSYTDASADFIGQMGEIVYNKFADQKPVTDVNAKYKITYVPGWFDADCTAATPNTIGATLTMPSAEETDEVDIYTRYTKELKGYTLIFKDYVENTDYTDPKYKNIKRMDNLMYGSVIAEDYFPVVEKEADTDRYTYGEVTWDYKNIWKYVEPNLSYQDGRPRYDIVFRTQRPRTENKLVTTFYDSEVTAWDSPDGGFIVTNTAITSSGSGIKIENWYGKSLLEDLDASIKIPVPADKEDFRFVYTFDHWEDAAGNTVVFDNEFKVTGNLEVYAKFRIKNEKSFTLSFMDANDFRTAGWADGTTSFDITVMFGDVVSDEAIDHAWELAASGAAVRSESQYCDYEFGGFKFENGDDPTDLFEKVYFRDEADYLNKKIIRASYVPNYDSYTVRYFNESYTDSAATYTIKRSDITLAVDFYEVVTKGAMAPADVPTKASTVNENYEFVGWISAEDVSVSAIDVEYARNDVPTRPAIGAAGDTIYKDEYYTVTMSSISGEVGYRVLSKLFVFDSDRTLYPVFNATARTYYFGGDDTPARRPATDPGTGTTTKEEVVDGSPTSSTPTGGQQLEQEMDLFEDETAQGSVNIDEDMDLDNDGLPLGATGTVQTSVFYVVSTVLFIISFVLLYVERRRRIDR